MTDGARDADVTGLLAERREVREAIESIRHAMYRINEGLARLQSAEKLGRADFWGGGLVTSWMKRDEVERASGTMRAVDLALAEVRDKLRGIGIEDTDSLVAGPAPRVSGLDVWFDNLVSDVLSRRRVKKANERLDLLGRVLVRVQSALNRRERGLSERIDAAQA
jgi:hypothetical protein